MSVKAEESDTNRPAVEKIVSDNELLESISSLPTKYLKILLDSDEKRGDFRKNIYTNLTLEKLVEAKGLDKSQYVLAKLIEMRKSIYLDALVTSKIKPLEKDIEELAKERYELKKEKYKTRHKVKLAVIYIQKNLNKKGDAKKRIDDIMFQLKDNEKNKDLFYELAKKYSDDKKAKSGGINKKWMLSPLDLNNSSELLKTVFSLKELGEISNVIETKNGFQIFRLMANIPSMQESFVKVKDNIIKEIMAELWKGKKKEVLSSLSPSEKQLNGIDDKRIKLLIESTYNIRKK